MQDPLKPPTGLRSPGRRLWLSVAERYVLTAAEVEMLAKRAGHATNWTVWRGLFGVFRSWLSMPLPQDANQPPDPHQGDTKPL
jgi:hypothetical protein